MDKITKTILDIFGQISQIPRESKHEEAISAWLVDWAKARNIEVETDEAMNVLMRVPAKKGYEQRPIVILQGHMDMVCEKTENADHDFRKDPIELVFKGDWLYANETTLGADNGIALAYALAVVDLDVPHPELELLFTVDEETGLTGANALKPNTLKGKYLLNIDSEDEGIFTIGCCGGVDTKIHFPLEKENIKSAYRTFELKIGGCVGGHSGQDIVKHRANANVLLVRTLWQILQTLPMQLLSVHGGTAHNAIPREATAVIAIPENKKNDADKVIAQCVEDFRNEYLKFEKGIKGSLKNKEHSGAAISAALAERILRFMLAFPNGPQALDPSVYEGGKLIAETSNNFAVIRTDDDALRILSSQRSQVMSSRDRMTQKIEMLAHLAGAEYKSGNGYASWQPDWNSDLLATVKELYKKMFGKDPVVNVVHGGLECGVIGAKHKGLDMISLGPTIENPHSPDERLFIPSIKKVWDFLTELLITL